MPLAETVKEQSQLSDSRQKLHHPGTLLLHSMTLFTLQNEFFRKNVRKEKITLICVKKKSVVQTYSIIHSIIKKKL